MPNLYYPACKKLLIDVVYHAATDWQEIENTEAEWVDDDHRALCNRYGFGNGEEELRSFFESEWFKIICEEFDDLSNTKILCGLGV